MVDHINIRVADYELSKKFYEAVLKPLGYKLAMESASGAGFSKGFIPDFWIKAGVPPVSELESEDSRRAGCGGPAVHIAFAGDDRSTVDAFYHAALAAGGRDNGAPGVRPEYHPNYYGAFVLDPAGTTSRQFATKSNEKTCAQTTRQGRKKEKVKRSQIIWSNDLNFELWFLVLSLMSRCSRACAGKFLKGFLTVCQNENCCQTSFEES